MPVTKSTHKNIKVFPFRSNNGSNIDIRDVASDEAKAGFYVYKIECSNVSYLGMIASINAMSTIKYHEKVLPNKVGKYVQRLRLTGVQSNPVMLIHRNEALQPILEAVVNSRVEDFCYSSEGQLHKIWKIEEPDLIYNIQQQCQLIDEFYIADGHHRVAAFQQEQSISKNKESKFNRLLGAVFAHTEVSIDAFNRGCFDLNGLSSKQFLGRLSETFTVVPMLKAFEPKSGNEFGMLLRGKWYLLTLPDEMQREAVKISNTAVELLETLIFDKHLGITDTRHSQRVAFIDGNKKQENFENYCRDNAIEVAFTFKAISPNELMQRIDESLTLPPHSTWFSPRVLPDMLYLKTGSGNEEASELTSLISAVRS